MIETLLIHALPMTPPRRFEHRDEPAAHRLWAEPTENDPAIILSRGFSNTFSSSSRPGSVDNLWIYLDAPPSSAARADLGELRSLLRAESRAKAVREADHIGNLFEIRRLTGFTWERLADLLDVDRRTLQNWVKGGEVRPANREHLAEVLSILRFADRGSAEDNATALNERSSSGVTPLEAIRHHRYAEARSYLSHGKSRPAASWSGPAWRRGIGEFQPMLRHDDADGSETSDSLPEMQKPASRSRVIKRG